LSHDLPPDELNRAPAAGLSFGFPPCFGNNRQDPEVGASEDCSRHRPSFQDLLPHAAALGMTFLQKKGWPAKYQTQNAENFTVLIAEHGSWNSIPLRGYRVSMVRVENNVPVSYDTFANFLTAAGVGRPVDLLEMSDGSLLVSDDFTNQVFRISYVG
jgi:glucose/arabinose dehydrogenase